MESNNLFSIHQHGFPGGHLCNTAAGSYQVMDKALVSGDCTIDMIYLEKPLIQPHLNALSTN